MAVRVPDESVQHQIADEDIRRNSNAWRWSPFQRQFTITLFQDVPNSFERMRPGAETADVHPGVRRIPLAEQFVTVYQRADVRKESRRDDARLFVINAEFVTRVW